MRPEILLVIAASLAAVEAPAAEVPAAETPATKTIVVGERFRAGELWRSLFGRDYRDLWTAPVELPMLDLQTFGGGLKAVRRLGHGQTQALALQGADGLAYTFRPVLKDPVGLLPPELRDTLAASVVRDQMASGHPAGHVVVPRLLEAVGVLHNRPQLVILPDDPALGEFRKDFGGQAGDIEEFTGQKGFRGALEIVDGEEMWKRQQATPEVRVDSRAYLAARLMDHLIGDWDRHRDQWRFARMPGKDRWQPIPEDRDQAFVRFEGAALSLLRPGLPFLVRFGKEHSSLDGLTFDSWDVDRRLLTDLERPAWEEVAAQVKSQLTDAVLEEAVRRMPAAYYDKDGARLLAGLRRRRDTLPAHALRFYRYLADQVDVRGTDAADRVEIERFPGGDVSVTLSGADASSPAYYHRRFRNGETREVRVYLLGGDDRVVTRGPRDGITVRVIGGDGSDRVDDSASGGTRVADADPSDQVLRGPGTSWDRKPYAVPPPNARGAWIPARDWGRRTLFPILRFTGSTDLGLLARLSLSTTGYGFRKYPYADHQTVGVAYSTARRAFRGDYTGLFPFENSKLAFRLGARASGIELLRFYGFGNETLGPAAADDRFLVDNQQYTLAPSLQVPLGRLDLQVGPIAKYVNTARELDTLVGRVQPYGAGRFGEVGLGAALTLDTTDATGLPSRGLRVRAGGAFYPAVWDAEQAFGAVQGEVTSYLGLRTGLAPALVLHAGGRRVMGTYPFFEAAFLGGPTLRGLRANRYAGDGSLYGGAELRFKLADAFLLVPCEVGLFGLGDVGRVFLEGEDSSRWHRGLGGGVYFTTPNRRNSLSVAAARSEGRTGFYVTTGLAF